MTKFTELKKIFSTLRGPRGCPWDRRQTHSSLIKNLKEETIEFIKSVRKRDYHNMKEELGDLLLQVMIHSQIASENKKFDIEDVISYLVKKLRRRHPHVFGNVRLKSAKDALKKWKEIKAGERMGKEVQR